MFIEHLFFWIIYDYLVLQGWIQGVFYDLGIVTCIITHHVVFGMEFFRNLISFYILYTYCYILDLWCYLEIYIMDILREYTWF